MEDAKQVEMTKIKQDFIDLIESRREEREVMADVLNSLNLLAAGHNDISDKIKQIKESIPPEGDIAFDNIRSLSQEIRNRLIEQERESGDEEFEKVDILTDKVINSCRTIKKIMAAILEDFYPLSEDMQKEADKIKVQCNGDPSAIDIDSPSDELLEFLDKLKIKISEDFSEINNTFFTLLGQVRDVEKTLVTDFASETGIRDMEDFESNINLQVGNITESFASYSTINEIKDVVFVKIKKIKSLVSLKKQSEVEKSNAAKENIKQLNKRINAVEKKAQKMSVKAREYRTAALKDGLTNLYSRGAFDSRMKESYADFVKKKKDFSIIVFDVDKFKGINDTLGHIAGDKVLIKISECLLESFRKDDFVARYGGDEFIVIIEDLTEEMAQERIALFNRNLKKRRFVSQKHGEIKLSVSAGTAKAMDGDTIESIIDRADKAMYEAKQARKKAESN